MKSNKQTATAKRLVLNRETLRTLAPRSLSEVHGGLFIPHMTFACIIVTEPETYDGPQCRPW